MVYTVRDDHYEGPILYVHPEDSAFGEAERRIDEIAKVIQLPISPPLPNHTSVLGVCTWEYKVEGED